MKQHLTGDDLAELTGAQRDRLRDLWQPGIYDLVLAVLCIDVENETYRQIEFIIGDIAVHQNYHDSVILLRDLKTMGFSVSAPEDSPGSAQSDPETVANPGTTAEFEDDDLVAGDQFEEYNREDCLPLLNLGQMIALLQRMSYGDTFFYLTIPTTEDYICSIGRDSYAADHEQAELCDVLWECLKEKL